MCSLHAVVIVATTCISVRIRRSKDNILLRSFTEFAVMNFNRFYALITSVLIISVWISCSFNIVENVMRKESILHIYVTKSTWLLQELQWTCKKNLYKICCYILWHTGKSIAPLHKCFSALVQVFFFNCIFLFHWLYISYGKHLLLQSNSVNIFIRNSLQIIQVDENFI